MEKMDNPDKMDNLDKMHIGQSELFGLFRQN